MAAPDNVLRGPATVEFDTAAGLVPAAFRNLQKATKDVFTINLDTEEAITYEELWYRTIRIASALQSMGAGLGKLVVIIGNDNLEVYSVYFATMFTGALPACVNPSLLADEIKQLLATLRPDYVFSDEGSYEKTLLAVQDLEKAPVIIGAQVEAPHVDYSDLLAADPDQFSFPTLPPSDKHVLGVMFSSGTTGLPKGTKVRDSGMQYIIDRIIPARMKVRMTQSPICTGSMIVFILSTIKCTGTLLVGGKTPDVIINALRKYKPCFWFSAPATALRIAQEPNLNHEDMSSVERMLCSGAGLTKDQVRYLNKRLFDNRIGLLNSYNSIETLAITTWPPDSDLVNSPKIGSVGKLQPLVQLKVVDEENGNVLGPGHEGKLLVKTPFIMDGYYNRPEETAAAFDNEGFYKTGDFGYYDTDGYIYICGRAKEIIKCKNRQVPPIQLEDILQQHPAVFESVVVGKPHPIDGFHPTAFVVLKKDVPPVDANELIKFVNDQVADYRKLHGGLYFIYDIPITPSGKKMRAEFSRKFFQ